MAMHHFGQISTDIYDYFNTPWTAMRTSTFRDMMISNLSGVLEHQYPLYGWGASSQLRNLDTTGGFTTFSEELPFSSHDYNFGFCVDTSKNTTVDPTAVANTVCDDTNPAITPFVFKVAAVGAQASSTGHAQVYGFNYTVVANFCKLAAPIKLSSVPRGSSSLTLTNERSGFSFESKFIIHFCWNGGQTYLESNVSAAVINQQFLANDTISIKYTSLGKRIEDQLAMTFVHGRNIEYPKSYYKAKSRMRYGTTNNRRDGTVWTTNFMAYLKPSETYFSRKYMITDSLTNMELVAKPLSAHAFEDVDTINELESGQAIKLWMSSTSFGASIGTDVCSASTVLACTGSSTPKSGARPLFYITCGSKKATTSNPYHFDPNWVDPVDNMNDMGIDPPPMTSSTVNDPSTPFKKPYLCKDEPISARAQWKLLGYFGNGCSALGSLEYKSDFCATVTAPTASPTAAPTTSPTVAPTTSPTAAPTNSPTAVPTTSPTAAPTNSPTSAPTTSPTSAPTTSPTAVPTTSPTAAPTNSPTSAPTNSPTVAPTTSPTSAPTDTSTAVPTISPTATPTNSPTSAPTNSPTAAPTTSPTSAPTDTSTAVPTTSPTATPTNSPTSAPTHSPTVAPTNSPTVAPTNSPTATPADAPTSAPTNSPTAKPTDAPTSAPTNSPTAAPTNSPTAAPTDAPTYATTGAPTSATTGAPTSIPTVAPTLRLTDAPIVAPTFRPTRAPTTPRPTRAPNTPRPTRAPNTPRPTRAPNTPRPTRARNTSKPTVSPPPVTCLQKGDYLALSDDALWTASTAGKNVGNCHIGFGSQRSFCDLYVSSATVGNNGNRGWPRNSNGLGTGCVKAPDFPKKMSGCFFQNAEYALSTAERESFCTESGKANALAQLRHAISTDQCVFACATLWD